MSDKRVYLYDSTLRDGAQTQGVDFSPADKVAIARALDELGIDYIEGGWPGANPTDDAFFADAPPLARAKLTAFGMTRRPGRSASNDPGLQALLVASAKAVTLVGKSWDFQVRVALGIELDENLRMIAESLAYVKDRVPEAIFDAEHFFDGYRANPDYALACATAAYRAGAGSCCATPMAAPCRTRSRPPYDRLPHRCRVIVWGSIATMIPTMRWPIRWRQCGGERARCRVP